MRPPCQHWRLCRAAGRFLQPSQPLSQQPWQRRRPRLGNGRGLPESRLARRAAAVESETLTATTGGLALEVRDVDRQHSRPEDLLRFEREGFFACPQLVSQEEAAALGKLLREVQSSEECELAALKHQVRVQHGSRIAGKCRDAAACKAKLRDLERRGEVSFFQYFNLHRYSDEVRNIAMSPRLSFWAARLLGVPRVRLYQDAVFMKRPGDGPTEWHSDLGLAPFDTNSFVTIWFALTPVPERGGSGLCFAIGSHRDFALSYHGNPEEDLSGRYEVTAPGGMTPGDATFHHGWTLHSAARVPEAEGPRLAWAVSFIADGARLLRTNPGAKLSEQEDAVSFEAWIHEVKGGAVVDHPLVPLVPEAF
ncbi:unnamed protein product [Polarella glacialis]|uniref:Uncharacterized protein n=1 Tax=Polarella glacialis TaxID=89957 RepID=A0A813E3T2_POLGL|nr:unnamed protein product [Polarella glacialis]